MEWEKPDESEKELKTDVPIQMVSGGAEAVLLLELFYLQCLKMTSDLRDSHHLEIELFFYHVVIYLVTIVHYIFNVLR